jgi:hypothetical protein
MSVNTLGERATLVLIETNTVIYGKFNQNKYGVL